jgi:hypothetical protein
VSKRGYGEGTVYKRKEEYWTASLMLANGKRTQIHSATRRKALQGPREVMRQTGGVQP